MTDPYRCGVYNADNYRPGAPADIARLARQHDLDVLAVLEADGYAHEVRDRLTEYRVFNRGLTHAARDSMILVRDGIDADRQRVHSLNTGPWERKAGQQQRGLHPGRKMRSVRIGPPGRRFRFGALHMPPPPHYNDHMPLRGRAYRRAIGRTATITEGWDRRSLTGWVLAGDWNATIAYREVRKLLLARDAEAKGMGIDWPMWSGVLVTSVHRVDAGGDHGHAMLFTVAP